MLDLTHATVLEGGLVPFARIVSAHCFLDLSKMDINTVIAVHIFKFIGSASICILLKTTFLLLVEKIIIIIIIITTIVIQLSAHHLVKMEGHAIAHSIVAVLVAGEVNSVNNVSTKIFRTAIMYIM